MAPVNAPFSWPKSSLSSNPVGMAAQFSFTNVFARRGLRLWMARDQFLSCTCVAINQHGGIGRSDCFHKPEDAAQLRALAHDLLKISLGANLVLKIKLFLGELVGEQLQPIL